MTYSELNKAEKAAVEALRHFEKYNKNKDDDLYMSDYYYAEGIYYTLAAIGYKSKTVTECGKYL